MLLNSHEGIVLKHPKSVYIPDARVDSWIKIKPEYLRTFAEDLDLLVVGAMYGRGKYKNKFGSILCAVRDSSAEQMKYLIFCAS